MTGVSWIEEAGVFSLPVAAETWDGYLNDVNGHHVSEQDGIGAIEAAAGTTGSHFSGDLFLAFSTANPGGFSPYNPASRPTPAGHTGPPDGGFAAHHAGMLVVRTTRTELCRRSGPGTPKGRGTPRPGA
jgi:hypothetical protein